MKFQAVEVVELLQYAALFTKLITIKIIAIIIIIIKKNKLE